MACNKQSDSGGCEPSQPPRKLTRTPVRARLQVLAVCGSIVATALVHAERSGLFAAQSPAKEDDHTWVLAVPTRRAPDAPPAEPPALLTGAEHVTPLTLRASVRRQLVGGRVQTLQQTIARTADRVHIASNGREWLFERNPRDPRRVSASLVEHHSKAIVLYEESDLRMMLGIRGWADVLVLGFDMHALNAYKRARTVRTVGGIRFTRYVRNEGNSPTADVWWSDEHFLASSFATVNTGGSTQFSIEHIRAGVDATLLQPPSARFHAYRVFDLADWLERH